MQEDFLTSRSSICRRYLDPARARAARTIHDHIATWTVLARERELKVHLRGGLNAGISRERSTRLCPSRALRRMAVAVNGLRIARELFDEIDGQKK